MCVCVCVCAYVYGCFCLYGAGVDVRGGVFRQFVLCIRTVTHFLSQSKRKETSNGCGIIHTYIGAHKHTHICIKPTGPGFSMVFGPGEGGGEGTARGL